MIKDDIRSWSREVLEVPNPELNGLPACPYAKQAWKQNKVNVVETDSLVETVVKEADWFDNTYDLVIVASYNFPEIDFFDTYIEYLNDTYSENDLHIMGFHPDYGAEDADLDFLYNNDWESSIEDEYAMMFIQSLSKVDDASLQLEKMGYYNVYPEEEYKALVLERRQRRLE
jgi:hypothetical protein